MRSRGEQLAADLSAREGEVAQVKEEQAEQARLLKRLQRKLLLVTKERDSFKVRNNASNFNYKNFIPIGHSAPEPELED